MLAEVSGATCRAYAATRPSQASARRELEDLRAAITRLVWPRVTASLCSRNDVI